MNGPLTGVRVLDLTHFVAGPWCTMLLADLGAEVTKVEPPGGEIGRSMGGVYAGGESAIFLGFNRGKRSIAVDLKQPEGLEAVLRLAAEADVVVQNFRPGTAERLGIGALLLRQKHPKLIYCIVTAFGNDGPYASRPANDPVIQALSGAMSASGKPGGPPVRMGVSLPDFAAGVLAATGILAALHRRRRTGKGSTVDLNLLDAQFYAQMDLLTGLPGAPEAGTGPEADGEPRPDAEHEPDAGPKSDEAPESIRGVYGCADGLAVWVDDGGLRQLGAAAGAGVPPGDSDSSRATALLQSRPRAEWLRLLTTAGMRCVPVLGLSDVLPGHPDRTVRPSHPTVAGLRQVRSPVGVDPPWPTVDTPPPRLGEHTREVLQDLGLESSEIDRLAASGTIRCQ